MEAPVNPPLPFDTSAFVTPDKPMNPHGSARLGLSRRIMKTFDLGLTLAARGIFDAIQLVNRHRPNPSFTPRWSDKPLLKSHERSKPTLGWPRETDSLCPSA